ncbi:hypothetical protein CAter282_1442 [Collimonas arenae]|uniref:Glutathione S-transferase n=1 Tax=Collimonas arenae TaxID=279058 RepID=A0A127QHZ9_9BURK|nr:hypothetical protein CAter10_1563 [Collimonas arenae]AMP09232.1 hypothetical protein CAter282_1442 [Collimonas arenae]
MRWNKFFGIDLDRWPAIARYMERIGSRAAVTSAIAAETAHA